MRPKVSVAVVTYNHERFIAQTLDSILNQSRDFAMEVVIGEDSSPDGTRAIVERYARDYPAEIRLLPTHGNVGASRNAVSVLTSCRGEYIAICDGDDYWSDPNKLAIQVRLLDERPDLSMCHTLVEYFEETSDGERIDSVQPENSEYWRDVKADDILDVSFITSCSVLYRRALLPPLDARFIDIGVGDRPVFLCLALRGDIGFINKVTARYRVHGANSFRLWSFEQKTASMARTCYFVARYASGAFRRRLLRKGNEFLYSTVAWLGGRRAFVEGWKVASFSPAMFAPLGPMVRIAPKVLAAWLYRFFFGTRRHA